MAFPQTLSRRRLLQGAAASWALALAGCATRTSFVPPGPAQLRLLGEATLPHRMNFKGTTVGGLSGLDYDPGTGLWVALSDDHSELQPARFYLLQVDLGRTLDVNVLHAVTLRKGDGLPYPRRALGGEVVDPESIRLLPGGRGALWTSEGNPKSGQQPMVRECRMDGSFVRAFDTPESLQFRRPGVGPRNNLTFEGLALAPDARTAWVSMEAPLQEDGPAPGIGDAGAPCRITAFDVATGKPTRQVAYQPDAIPQPPKVPGAPAENGISEILMVDADRMLVLERAFSAGVGTSLRIYEIDTREGSDTLAVERLRGSGVRIAPKRFIADFAQLGLKRLDNTEGMCWGPPLANGHRTLYVVSDDNFRSEQVTQFAAFEYLGPA